ncbi:right-handed parallel beta-helix repeat-containing protein [Streptomyces sp. UC4497]
MGTAWPASPLAAGRASAVAVVDNADTVRMAWVGTPDARPADSGLLTLQAALNAAAAGQTVSFDPEDYVFANRLTVPREVTLATSGPSVLFARFTVTGGGLSAADGNVSLGVSATGAVVTVNTAGATLRRLKVVNPNAVARPTGIQLAAAATGVVIDRFTMDGGDQASSFGINLTTGSARVANAAISGVATGVGVTGTSTAGGIAVEGGSIQASLTGIGLGATTTPTVADVTVSGPGNAGTGIDLANSSGAHVNSPSVSDFARGIGTTNTSTAAGPDITDAVVTRVGREGISLGSTDGAHVTTPQITGTDTATSAGIQLYKATAAVLDRVRISHFSSGVVTNFADTGAGPKIVSPQISEVSTAGISLGSTQGTRITDPTISGDGTASSSGIGLVNSGKTSVTGGTITGFDTGISTQSSMDGTSRRDDYSLTDLRITGTPTGSTGISLLGAVNATISDVHADVTGGGVVLHNAADVDVRRLTVTGHDGPTPTSGAAILKAYETRNVSVDTSSIQDGSYGFYLRDTDGMKITNTQVANISEYGIHGRSVTNLDVGASRFADMGAVGMLSALDAATGVSEDIDIHDSVMSGNGGGLRLNSGTRDVRFTRNTVSGQPSTVVAAPAHDVTVADNTVTQDGAGGQAAVMATPLYEDAARPGSYSSSGITVRDNIFRGEGTFVQAGSADPSTPDAQRRALRDAVLVTGNTFPAGSTAVRNFPNALTGDDAPAARSRARAAADPVAVDARDYDNPNDWGSACRATGYLDDGLVYDGGGAAVRELTSARALYPTDCIELSLAEDLDSGPDATFRTGDLVTWTLTPRNSGLRAAPAGWSVTQLLPDGVELVSLSGKGYTVDDRTATATDALATGTEGPALKVTVRITAEADKDVTMKNVAYVAPLAPENSTDLDGDGYADVIKEYRSPLVVPTLATDTDESATDNDTQGRWTVTADSTPPSPTPSPTPTPTPTASGTPVPVPSPTGHGSGSGSLADTGFDRYTQALTAAALLLVAAGATVWGIVRRRRA